MEACVVALAINLISILFGFYFDLYFIWWEMVALAVNLIWFSWSSVEIDQTHS